MTKKGLKTGAKLPARYEGGNPYVLLCLAILVRAEADKNMKYGADGEECKNGDDTLWSEFIETKTYKQGIDKADSLQLAWGIVGYILGLDKE